MQHWELRSSLSNITGHLSHRLELKGKIDLNAVYAAGEDPKLQCSLFAPAFQLVHAQQNLCMSW